MTNEQAVADTKPGERHRNNFNFLRLLLATLVLLSHSRETVDGSRVREPLTMWFGTLSFGDLAVNGFFIISGYLITSSWLRQPQAGVYLKKRLARIVPGFWVCGLICGLIVAPAVAGFSLYYTQENWRRFFTNLLFLQYHGPLVRLGGGSSFQFNAAVWTIHLEMLCYLLLLGLGLAGLLKRPPLILAAWILVVVLWPVQPVREFLGRYAVVPLLLPMPAALHRVVMFFLAGSAAFLYRDRIRFTWWGAVLAFFVSVLALRDPVWGQAILTASFGYLILAIAEARIPWLERFQRGSDISYGTYLYGWPIQALLALYAPGLPYAVNFGLSCLGAYTCGFASWHLVEKWFLSWRRG